MSEVDFTDKDYTKAIVTGIVVGVPLLAVIAFVAFEAVQPDASTGALAWLAVWTGLWAGVFVGGTIAVWNYVRRLEH